MFHLGSIGGTTIDVDLTFLILIFFFALSSYDPNKGAAYALVWAPILFLSVLLHELAHAAAIGLFGYGSSRIVLGGIGGLTFNERRARPWHDMIISLAGPLSSFALAYLCFVIEMRVAYVQQDKMLRVFLPLMVSASVIWGIFNLLPIPPLDGGSALRNLLRSLIRDELAFVITIWIAMISGIAVIVYALLVWRQLFVAILIGWFTYNNYQQWNLYRQRGYPGDE